jgi:Zn-dependent peptidase ImmA (M78 family)/transcriptional regulator with XRE-family HTH domain
MADKVVNFPTAVVRNRVAPRLVPGRLRDARKAMRLSQPQLGELVGVTRQSISAYEAGQKVPESPTFERLVTVLGQPPSFFTTEDKPVFGAYGPRFYRKTGPDTDRRNEACTVLGNWFVQVTRYFDAHINYPPVDIPAAQPADPSGRYTGEEIETAAGDCRKQWGLGLGPISNVLALLESKGVTACRYSIDGERVDAFSFWNGDRPFIFMAAERESGARVRYDLAHELGHLILHRWIEAAEIEDPKTLKEIEREADRFASAFLLPGKSFANEVYTPRLDAFVDLKRRWKVSIQAMVYRSRDLELIDEDQFTNLYKSISFRKWRTREPLDDPAQIAIEQPRVLSKAARLLLDSGRRHRDEICAELAIAPQLIEKFCDLPHGTLTSPPEIPTVEPRLT